ncbi:MAG: ABC transporter ATP-binding protein/permease [Lachnospiraceae bacterium]|nr:ABC transporter ATP-binding protein/permease [Ruminococcus sp.]MCM1274328.1 ABC transporter ATP-binding protein/permease [Lachnospiraceae bacterium]
MFRLARYLKEFKLNVTVGPVCKFTEAVFELIVPLVMAEIIDVGIKNADTGYIWRHGITLVVLAVCGLTFALICQYMASVASQGVGTRLRDDLYKHINTLSYKELDTLGTAALVTRISNDVNQVQTAVAMLIRLVVRAPFLVIGATVMAFTISARLSLIFLGAMAAIVAVMYPIMRVTVKLFKQQQRSLDGISRITRENLSGVRVVRAFSRQDYEKERFEETAEEYRKFAVRAGRINALLNPAIFIAVNAAYLLIVWLGGGFVDGGVDGLTQGKVIALVNYMTQISLALVVVANLVTIFTKAAASAARINEIFDMQPSVVGAESSPKQDESAPAVEFENVSFSYVGGENSLEKISFTLGRGETLGIIGGTGSGKSTLVNLLCRFYDCDSGSVRINGADVRDYPTEELRRLVGIVPQKTELLSGTLRENMALGRTDIPDERIYKALEIAQAKEFTDNLDGGLDARILQGGKNLSGGQKQRLTIARAVAQDPEILILDDSSSALDYATDASLRKALKMLPTTCVIVSQRANSIRHADKIIVLDDGEAVGIGTHAQLLKSCEVYREICLTQYTEEELLEQENEEGGAQNG